MTNHNVLWFNTGQGLNLQWETGASREEEGRLDSDQNLEMQEVWPLVATSGHSSYFGGQSGQLLVKDALSTPPPSCYLE